MQKRSKLTHIVNSLKASPEIWQKAICKYWQLGSQAGLGFAIGEPDDSPAKALAREGYELITEIEDVAIGTDWLTSIIVVTECYGPWAVDITDSLLLTTVKPKTPTHAIQISQTNKNNIKNITKPQ